MPTLLLALALARPAAAGDAAPLAAWLPWSAPARIAEDHGMIRADGGASLGGESTLSAGGFVEGAPTSRVAVRVGGGWGGSGDADADADSSLSLYGTVRGDLLRQEKSGLNLAAAATYKRTGFGGSAGEVEGTLAASHTFSGLETGGALTFGHALDRDEGDAELALHATRVLGGGFSAGVDMRGRARLGEDCGDEPEACAGEETDADADHAADWAGGPVLAWSKGPAVILVVPGAQVVAGPGGVQTGATAMASVGVGF